MRLLAVTATQNMMYLTVLACAGVLGLAGCSSEKPTSSSSASTAGGSAEPAGAGKPAAGTTSTAGATATGTGGMRAPTATGGSRATGNGGSTMTASGGRSGTAGATTAAGGNSASAGSSAGGGTAGAAAGSSASAGAGGCTREALSSATDMFYAALAAHNASMLQLADGVKITENGMKIEPGKGLWEKAGMLKYKHTAFDVDKCMSVSESVVPDGSTDIPVGTRLKLADGKLSEIELIVVRAGDYTVFGSPFASNTMAIAASKDKVKWLEVVPADQRNTYAEITGWLERYFKTFSKGGCNLADNCQRLENGGGNFACSAALTCDMSASLMGSGTLKPRLLVADVETGIGVGFTMFMGHTDFHMIKMYGTKVYAVHAILSAADNSGWD